MGQAIEKLFDQWNIYEFDTPDPLLLSKLVGIGLGSLRITVFRENNEKQHEQ